MKRPMKMIAALLIAATTGVFAQEQAAPRQERKATPAQETTKPAEVTPATPSTSPQAPDAPQRAERKPLTKEQQAERLATNLKNRLNLSEDQYKKVYDMMLKRRSEQMKDREEMRKRNEETKAEMKAILTPEQYARYEEMKGERRSNRSAPVMKDQAKPAPDSPAKETDDKQ